MQLIETIRASTAVNSVLFTNIPQNGKDLVCLISARLTGNGSILQVKPNDLGTLFVNRSHINMAGTALTYAQSSNLQITAAAAGTASTANSFSNTQIYIKDYVLGQWGTSNRNFSLFAESITENNTTNNGVMRYTSGYFRGTANIAPITSLGFSAPEGGNDIGIGSTFSLYKIG